MENNEQNNQPINTTENQIPTATNVTPDINPVEPAVSEPAVSEPVKQVEPPVVTAPTEPVVEPKIEQPTVEPKSKKNSNPILVVIIILLLACIGYLVYDNYIKEKPAPNTNSGQTVDNQQKTDEPTVKDQTPTTSNEGNDVTDKESITNTDERFIYKNLSTECTDEEIKTAIQKYEDLLSETYNESFTFLGYVGYENAREKVNPTAVSYKGNDHATATTIDFNDFKTKMTNYMTESYFDNHFNEKYVANVDGKLTLLFSGASGVKYTVEEVFKFKNESENKYYAIEKNTTTSSETKTIQEYRVSKANGKCVIGE